MSSDLNFGGFGVSFGIDGPNVLVDAVMAALHERAWLEPVGEATDVTYELREVGGVVTVTRFDGTDHAHVGDAPDPTTAADLTVDDVHQQLAHRSDEYLFVHAGAVEWHGLGIAIPGRSLTGKTTLVAALVSAGAGYLSDEFAVLDADGLVHPYPRPLTVRDGCGGGRLVSVSELGGAVAEDPVPLGLIVSTRYEPGARFELSRVDGARSLLPLIDNALVARTRPRHTIVTIAPLAGKVATLVGLRGEAEDALRDILTEAERVADESAASLTTP